MTSDVCLLDVWRLSVACIGPKSRTKRPRKTKIGTEVAHVTGDSDTTFKIRRSRSPGRFTHRGVNASGRRREALRRPQRKERGGAYCGGRPPTACDISSTRDEQQALWISCLVMHFQRLQAERQLTDNTYKALTVRQATNKNKWQYSNSNSK